MQTTVISNSEADTIALGEKIGANLVGGEVLVLKSDLGGGKTTFVRGLARGLGSTDPVASPSFTISYVYNARADKELHHFDFYRLAEPGVVKSELQEVLGDPGVITAVEWGDVVEDALPDECIQVEITAGEANDERSIRVSVPNKYEYVMEGVN